MRHSAFAQFDGSSLIADHVMCPGEHPFNGQRTDRVVQRLGEGFPPPTSPQGPLKVSDPGMIDVQGLEHPQLPISIVELLGNLQAARDWTASLNGIGLIECRPSA